VSSGQIAIPIVGGGLMSKYAVYNVYRDYQYFVTIWNTKKIVKSFVELKNAKKFCRDFGHGEDNPILTSLPPIAYVANKNGEVVYNPRFKKA